MYSVASNTAFTGGNTGAIFGGFDGGSFSVGTKGFLGFKLDFGDLQTQIVIGVLVALTIALLRWWF